MKLHDILEPQQLDEINLKQAATAGMIGAATLGSAPPQLPVHQERPPIVQKAPELSQSQQGMKDKVWNSWKRNDKLSKEIAAEFKINTDLASYIVKVANKNARSDFPTADDILAIIGIESSFRPTAKSGLKKDPAVGLMQIRPNVWNIPAQELLNVDQNIEHGANILAKYYQRLKNKDAAIQAYNIGITKFRRGARTAKYLNKYQSQLDTFVRI